MRRRELFGKNDVPKYTLVDWIENTNANSAIETNVTFINSNNYKFIGTVTPIQYNRNYTTLLVGFGDGVTDANNKRWRFSWRGASNSWTVLFNSSTNGRVVYFTQDLIGVRTSFQLDYSGITVNGVTHKPTKLSSGTFKTNKLILGEDNTNSGIMRWHQLDVYLNNVLISKLRPCLTDNKYTMVDLLTNYLCPTLGIGQWMGGVICKLLILRSLSPSVERRAA